MDVRASDGERDATGTRLRDAAGDGRLTLEELTDRTEAAANAVMRSDIHTRALFGNVDLLVPAGSGHGVSSGSRRINLLGLPLTPRSRRASRAPVGRPHRPGGVVTGHSGPVARLGGLRMRLCLL